MTENYYTNVPVAMIFFNRPDVFKKAFEAVRQVKPKKLFLIQDGARQNREDDVKNIEKCRDIVRNIDWECDVVRDYSDTNLGCGRRMYTGITNAFKTVDRLIIIEDDIVTTKDFFIFCEELLERYKDDQRIQRISGMCHMGEYKKSPYSYGFTNISSCWGWATWKRSWQDMDYEMSFLDNDYIMQCFAKNYRYKKDAKSLIKTGHQRRAILKSGKRLSAWTYQFSMGGRLNNRLDITPCKNLIQCVGLTEDSSHASNNIKKIPKGLQKVFFANTYNMDNPIIHPPYIMEDVQMENEIRRVLGWTPVLRVTRRVEGILRKIIYGDTNILLKKLANRIKRGNK